MRELHNAGDGVHRGLSYSTGVEAKGAWQVCLCLLHNPHLVYYWVAGPVHSAEQQIEFEAIAQEDSGDIAVTYRP